MGFRIREIEAECKFSSTLTVEALARAIPPDAIAHVLAEQAATHQRERKLSMPVVVWLIIALHLYTTLSIGAMLSKLARLAFHLAACAYCAALQTAHAPQRPWSDPGAFFVFTAFPDARARSETSARARNRSGMVRRLEKLRKMRRGYVSTARGAGPCGWRYTMPVRRIEQ